MRYLLLLLVLLVSCKKETPTLSFSPEKSMVQKIINPQGKTIEYRFNVPERYVRDTLEQHTFAYYLRNLPLKPAGSKVKYYNGDTKSNWNVYCGVVDMEIGTRDLQQCADAVMRLRGEYLFDQKKYDQIHFNFINDGKPRYYTEYAKDDRSYQKFRTYMNYIMAYANTASLRAEMEAVAFMDMKIGDAFIQKGRPFGHAVIVVDMATDPSTGKKVYMLAQSYMPAQETQILINRNDREISPWYELLEGTIFTPEWTFETSDLRRFAN